MDDVCRCGRVIEQPATGRRRRWCFVCSPRAPKNARADVIAFPTKDPNEEGALTAASRAALEAAGVDGWKAEAVYAVSRLIDQGKHGASGAAGTIKCHRESLQFALQDADDHEADVIWQIFNAKD